MMVPLVTAIVIDDLVLFPSVCVWFCVCVCVCPVPAPTQAPTEPPTTEPPPTIPTAKEGEQEASHTLTILLF